MKVLVEKKFAFVELVWSAYIVNKSDIMYVSYYHTVLGTCVVSRPIEDEESSDSDREVEDGTALPDAEPDDDDDGTTLHEYVLIHLWGYSYILYFAV